jgi:uncharacterized protein involved in exopolysaccharide biosynthesis
MQNAGRASACEVQVWQAIRLEVSCVRIIVFPEPSREAINVDREPLMVDDESKQRAPIETARPRPQVPNHRPTAGDWPASEAEETSVLELATVLLKRWKLVAGLPLTAAILAAVVSLQLPTQFTATATFVPESRAPSLSLPSGLAGLAAQFGVAVPGGGNASPQFYADVLASRTLRDEVLQTRFRDPRSAAPRDSATLLGLLDIGGDNEHQRLENGRKKLEGAVAVRVDNETNIVSLSVETPHPPLSADVANYFIGLLNRFNLETRQSRAQERRRFVEERMGEAEQELREAEDGLKGFLEGNRQFRGSPELTFEYERLQRQVTIKQEVFTSLRSAYEEARIAEVNDTPVITVIDQAIPSEEKSSPKRRRIVIVTFILAGLFGIFGAFGREYIDRARVSDQEDYEKLTSHWETLKSDLRALPRRARRRTS